MKWRVTDSSKKNGELFVDFQIPVGAEYPPGSLHLYQQAVSAHTTCQGMPQLSSLLFSSRFIRALILCSYICRLLSLRTLTPHYTSAAFI